MKSNFAPLVDYADLLPVSLGNEPSQALLFDGISSAVPTIVNGKVIFGGAVNKLGGKKQPFEVPFSRIIDYKMHCSRPSSKKKIRVKCCAPDACTNKEFAALHFLFKNSADFPIALSYGKTEHSILVPLVEDCGATDCCRMMKSLTDHFAAQNEYFPITGVASQIGSTWYFDIEAKNAGQDFIVTGAENFLVSEVLPNFLSQLTAKKISNWFDSPIVTDCDPDKPMEILEIQYKEFVSYFGGDGNGWSSPNITSEVKMAQDNMIPCVFDPNVPQSMTAKAALLAILDCTGMAATVRNYMVVPGNATCEDGPIFNYCITKTDLGDAAALADVKADYPTFVDAKLTSHVGAVGVSGLSQYTVSFLNQTSAPAGATNNSVVDTIVAGSCDPECETGDCGALTPCTSC